MVVDHMCEVVGVSLRELWHNHSSELASTTIVVHTSLALLLCTAMGWLYWWPLLRLGAVVALCSFVGQAQLLAAPRANKAVPARGPPAAEGQEGGADAEAQLVQLQLRLDGLRAQLQDAQQARAAAETDTLDIQTDLEHTTARLQSTVDELLAAQEEISAHKATAQMAAEEVADLEAQHRRELVREREERDSLQRLIATQHQQLYEYAVRQEAAD